MKKALPIISAVFVLFVGLGFLLYPTVSNWLAERGQSYAAQEYDENVVKMKAEAIAEEFAKAKKYNDSLSGANIEDPFIPQSGAVLPDNYTTILNTDEMMGYLEIPKIDVNIPIYHGTSDEVLKKGVGHMEMTAFPTGGEGNHAVLTGHTGLSTTKLFTNLDQLELDDIFYITVLDQTLAYQVNQILVVTPDNTEDLMPVTGKDYVTLVTCTPYRINSHRLLVRGIRIPYEEAAAKQADGEGAEINWRVVMIAAATILAALAFVVYKCINRRRQRGGQR